MVNLCSFCHSVYTLITHSSVVPLKRSLPTPTSVPRKRPNNSSTTRVLHIPSTFRPNSPESSQPTPVTPNSTSYEYLHSTELQAIQALIVAYTSRDVCLACHISGDTQYPEIHALGRCRSRLAGAQDETYKSWRRTAFNFEFGRECIGCGIPKDVSFLALSVSQFLIRAFRYTFQTAPIKRPNYSIAIAWAAAAHGGRHFVRLGIWFCGTRT
jgi:hypothetical protein